MVRRSPAGSVVGERTTWSRSRAVDGTDIDTWAKLHGELDDTDFDGDEDAQPDGSTWRRNRRVKRSRHARILGVGPDERNIYRKDLDARAGHRSATGSRAAGLGVGYELHTAVLARDAGWSNGIDRLNLGPDVPPVITTISLVPAGSRRDDAIVPKLIAARPAASTSTTSCGTGGTRSFAPRTRTTR